MVLFFYGPNSFDLRRKVKELTNRYETKAGNNFGLERFDGSDQSLNPDTVISALTNLPLLGDNRLVIIQDLLSNKSLAEPVIASLDQVPKSTVAVFVESPGDERMKLFKELKAKAKPKKFDHLNGPQLKSWVQKTTADLDGKIDDASAHYLIEQVSEDQWRLYNELCKLVNFNKVINKESINELVEPTFTNTIFDLLEAVSRQDIARALDLYGGLRSNKVQPIYVLSMLGWQLKNLLVVKSAESVGSPARQIVQDFKMSPFVVNKSVAAVRDISWRSLKAAHTLLVATDYRLKTTSVDPDALIEQLIYDTAQVFGSRQVAAT